MIDTGTLIEVRDLKKHYPVRRTLGSPHDWLKAVDGVSFGVHENRVFAIVGESGCGKSTIAKLMLRLTGPTEGGIYFRGRDIQGLKGPDLKAFRRAVQIVFQDPFASLNPRRTVYQTLSEPMKIHGMARSKDELVSRVEQLLVRVGLDNVLDRYPHEFSGGQRQRICIARALAVGPEVIVADEPLSALDVSIQAQILNLLSELREQSGLSYLLISHDLRVVEYFSDEVGVMYLGRIVEQAPTEGLFKRPLHPYTVMLLNSAPSIDAARRKRQVLEGEVPSPIDIPRGCSFHTRCPRRFAPCDRIEPKLRPTAEGASVSCHLYHEPHV